MGSSKMIPETRTNEVRVLINDPRSIVLATFLLTLYVPKKLTEKGVRIK